MTRFVIFVKTKVQKEIDDIPKDSFKQIFEAIDSLSENPHPKGSIKLNATECLYRVRAGDYRILYEVHHKTKEIIIIHIRHRRNAYRSL